MSNLSITLKDNARRLPSKDAMNRAKAGDSDLNIYDRTKDMIIRGGLNVYPREVEELLPISATCKILKRELR